MPAGPPFTMHTVLSGPHIQVIIGGELDLTAAPGLAQALQELRDAAVGGLVLHLGGVEFLDCACARILARAVSTWPGTGPAMICDPSPAVRRLFQLTGLAAVTGINEPSTPRPAAPVPAQHQPAAQDNCPAAPAMTCDQDMYRPLHRVSDLHALVTGPATLPVLTQLTQTTTPPAATTDPPGGARP